ncbi:hypothetical protein EVAR_86517_1 [Eumeta japonica]|uniref:Uncharacterized protein n=1 Tax=Eumeta variegata TaxID=151549 RepID=A0A4C1VNY4_EUMVA|nr:hypothetical protein EVAR_86517_1 [Eumeta japonica]
MAVFVCGTQPARRGRWGAAVRTAGGRGAAAGPRGGRGTEAVACDAITPYSLPLLSDPSRRIVWCGKLTALRRFPLQANALGVWLLQNAHVSTRHKNTTEFHYYDGCFGDSTQHMLEACSGQRMVVMREDLSLSLSAIA